MNAPHPADGTSARTHMALDPLREIVAGDVLEPGSPGYDEARSVWNGMIDRRPAVIVRCAGAEDVAAAVRFAREKGIPLAVKGAGHNIAGSAVIDDGLVIDLSGLRGVEVDAASMSARVQPGATLGDIDAVTQEHGLAVPTGINSTTGIAGLTLGGGFGWLSRKHGMTVDSLLAVEMVTADGEHTRASATENPDLFWAIRGGGGNFGVVTSFTFRVHPVGPEVMAGLIVHDLAHAPTVMRQIRDLAGDAPDELSVWMVARKAPPLPFLPEEWHGREVLVVAAMYAGDMAEGEEAMAPFRALGDPIADVISPHPFAGWQQAFDPLLTPGARNYWKSHDFDALTDELIDAIVDATWRLPTPECEIFVPQMGGAANRVAADATAYPHRDVAWVMNIHTRWQDPADDERCLAWARDVFQAMAPMATGGVYVNFMPEDETDRVRSAYGSNYDRLAEVKATWDPENVFRANMNIRPAVPA
jgi:FAD/FMN-containing dehydrogenase